jgi:hypothetical protein
LTREQVAGGNPTTDPGSQKADFAGPQRKASSATSGLSRGLSDVV